ncbi:MAG TPA: dicarboxylate/amino acid:cation symporter, partial [Polyangiaceae bacterium]|nr:dicarboxylate/amino acid:cation symporter [Polyangiaceae bacterium]
ASLALTVGLFMSNLLHPGRSLSAIARSEEIPAAFTDKKLDFLAMLKGYVPTNMVTPFAENLVLTIILIAVLFGAGLRKVRADQRAQGLEHYLVVESLIKSLLRLMEVVLGWVIHTIPLAVFGVVASAVGEHGFAPLSGLAVYVGVGLTGLALHILITYQTLLVFVVKMPLRVFWKAARDPIVYAAGANSSLATLPITLKALDRLKVPKSASALGACVGTNFNNDGIILYEGMAVLFVAQASGIDLSLAQQLSAALVCMVAAMGVAGVPEAGMISLALVLNTLKLPLDLLPLLLTVDWIIARGRSVTNVLSDMMLSLLVAKGETSDDAEPERGSESAAQ